MDNTLIVYASRHGTVKKSARYLFQLMSGKVDICDLKERNVLPDISTYDTVIIGGSIHWGTIQPVVAEFCRLNLEELKRKRLGLFINCLYSGEKAQEELNHAFPEELNEVAVARDYFGGELENLSFWERFITSQLVLKEELMVALSKEKIEKFAEKINSDGEK